MHVRIVCAHRAELAVHVARCCHLTCSKSVPLSIMPNAMHPIKGMPDFCVICTVSIVLRYVNWVYKNCCLDLLKIDSKKIKKHLQKLFCASMGICIIVRIKALHCLIQRDSYIPGSNINCIYSKDWRFFPANCKYGRLLLFRQNLCQLL